MTEAEYNKAMDEIVAMSLRNPKSDTPDGQRLNALIDQVSAYEKLLYPCLPSEPWWKGPPC